MVLLVVAALLRMPPVFLTHLTQMCQKSQSGLDDGGNEDDCGLQLLSRSGATAGHRLSALRRSEPPMPSTLWVLCLTKCKVPLLLQTAEAEEVLTRSEEVCACHV